MGGVISGWSKVDAVLWDLDGTLIDTSSSSLVALKEILEEDFTVSFDLAKVTPIIEQQSHTGKKREKWDWAVRMWRESKQHPLPCSKPFPARFIHQYAPHRAK